jgi:hypothetical protein
MRFFLKISLSLFAFLLANSNMALAADCAALFNDLHSYTQTPTIGNCRPNFNALHVKMATNRNDGRYVSYAEGTTTERFTGDFRFPLNPSFGGTTLQTFSDRSKDYYETRCEPGSFCFPTKQNFAATAADQLGLTFNSGKVTLTLKSWGNGKITIPLACTDSGMMYGEKDGTFFTFSFQKTVYENTCIR